LERWEGRPCEGGVCELILTEPLLSGVGDHPSRHAR
jgi:hypothetical protein